VRQGGGGERRVGEGATGGRSILAKMTLIDDNEARMAIGKYE